MYGLRCCARQVVRPCKSSIPPGPYGRSCGPRDTDDPQFPRPAVPAALALCEVFNYLYSEIAVGSTAADAW